MSRYLYIDDLKVRISDHEPNHSADRLRGRNDIEIYTVDICNNKLDIEPQVIRAAERHGLSDSHLSAIMAAAEDYARELAAAKAAKEAKEEAIDDTSSDGRITALRLQEQVQTNEALAGLTKPTTREEIKSMSATTGISQNKIKDYFGIRR